MRVARIIFPLEIPIVGINFGTLGFMTEFRAEEALDKLLVIIEGGGWTEERAMLQAAVTRTGNKYHALNDVVVGRGKFLRLVNIQVHIDGEAFTKYRADAVIVATSTGSTGYSLAANGPILHPESRDIILKAVCPHLSMDKAVVLAPASKVRLKVFTNHGAVVSMDGQVEEPLNTEDEIEVSLSPQCDQVHPLAAQERILFYAGIQTEREVIIRIMITRHCEAEGTWQSFDRRK